MIVLSRFLFCIFMILSIHPQEGQPLNNSSKGPGKSLCNYYRTIFADCVLNEIPIKEFPDSCTAFTFEKLNMGLTLNLFESISEDDDEVLDMLCKTGKSVYINYGYEPGEWQIILACMACNAINAVEESKSINAFLKEYPGVTGLMLRNLEIFDRTTESVGYTENLVKYIETVKQETGLQIALNLRADEIFVYYKSPKFPWLDFSALNKCVDFYVLQLFSFFNECTDSMRNGVTPVNGNQEYTLEKLEYALRKSDIPKEKTYFSLVLSPKSRMDEHPCAVNYEMMCTSPENAKSWCADTQKTHFEKGQWIKKNGAGFIGFSLNFDDAHGCCDCGPYPSFNAISAGLNGSASIPACPLYDRC